MQPVPGDEGEDPEFSLKFTVSSPSRRQARYPVWNSESRSPKVRFSRGLVAERPGAGEGA